MHSAQMKLSVGDFQKYTKAMIDLLEDQQFLYQLLDAKDAVKIIKEVSYLHVKPYFPPSNKRYPFTVWLQRERDRERERERKEITRYTLAQP